MVGYAISADSFVGTCTPQSDGRQGILEFEEWKTKFVKIFPTAGPLISYGGKCVMNDGSQWLSIMLNNYESRPALLVHLDAQQKFLGQFNGVYSFTGDVEAGKPLLVSSGSMVLVTEGFSDSEEGLDWQFSAIDLRTGEKRDATPEEKALLPEPYSNF